ncbi:MAG: hypothetical protein Q7S18_01805 [bacterium]|nr:hypothetical protein [bacterium]
MLAKEIIDEILKIVQEKKLANIKSATLELGSIALSHDNFPKHLEDTNINNLIFALKNISKNSILKNTKFRIHQVSGDNWKVKSIEMR